MLSEFLKAILHYITYKLKVFEAFCDGLNARGL